MVSNSLLYQNEQFSSSKTHSVLNSHPTVPSPRALLVVAPKNWRLTRFANTLQELGYKCLVETSLEGAKFRTRNTQFDLIILDEQLPQKYRLLNHPKQFFDRRFKEPAIIFLSNSSNTTQTLPRRPYVSLNDSISSLSSAFTKAKSTQKLDAQNLPNRIGEYEILEQIGRGGMGLVYKARNTLNGQECAIKVLRQKHYSEVGLQRFLREANILMELDHPNLVTVHKVGAHEKSAYFVMDLLPGRSLDKFQGCWSNKRTAVILYKMARALAYIHSKNTLHRDIKPANIIVDRDMSVTLTDFGLARRSTDVKMTATNAVVGTVRYIAPEVMMGKGHTTHADLFSLGIVALEMLTGQRAFKTRETYEIMRILVEGRLPKASSYEFIDPDLANIIDRLTAFNPFDRFNSAASLCSSLNAWLRFKCQSKGK